MQRSLTGQWWANTGLAGFVPTEVKEKSLLINVL
jgi:hypothetical protein